MNFRSTEEAYVSVPKFNKNLDVIPISIESVPVSEKGKIKVELMPGEIQILQIGEFEIK